MISFPYDSHYIKPQSQQQDTPGGDASGTMKSGTRLRLSLSAEEVARRWFACRMK